MKKQNLEKLQYPIGKFNSPDAISKEMVNEWIDILENFPNQLNNLTCNLSKEQLDTTYRPQGWTIRQVIHHLSDSHHNSYTRFKWALTENEPVIKVYYEDRWAELKDSKKGPIQLSLNNLKALHAKWVYLLKNLSENELQRVFIHPDGDEKVSLNQNIGIYAWHCKHHFAHIENLMRLKNWK